MADDRERDEAADETKVSAQIPPEAVGDEASAGQGAGDTDETPAVSSEAGRSGEIVFARDAAEAAESFSSGAADDEDDIPPPPPPPELEPAPAEPLPYEHAPPRPAAAEVASAEPPPEPPSPEPPAPPATESAYGTGAPPSEPPSGRSYEPAGGTSPAEADRKGAASSGDSFAARPELYAAGAFVGGFVIARALKFFFGEDDE
jgi:hypothetical protein